MNYVQPVIRTLSADGQLHEFPPGTPSDVVDKAMADYAASKANPLAAKAAAGDSAARSQMLDNLSAKDPLTVGNVAHDAGQMALGAGAGVAGIPGNLETLGRWGLSKLTDKVSPVNKIPNSSDIQNAIGGEPQSREDSGARLLGGLFSPLAAQKGTQALAAVAKPLATNTLGLTTGAGSKAIEGAYDAGKAGGPAGQTFLDNMRGNVPATDVVDSAKDAVAQLGRDRAAAYRAGIGSTIKGDPAVLDMQPVHDAVAKTLDVGKFKGVSLSDSAQKVRQSIMDVLTDWNSLDPAEYHTAEGFDALKQKIGNLAYEGNLADAAKPGSPGAKIIGGVYNAIKDQITQQAPGYAKVMKDYSQASDELRNIQSTLSLNPKANVDTSLRKLQSIMRNNVAANYGARTQMAGRLADAGAKDLIPALSGQMLNSVVPRGLASAGDALAIGGNVLAGHPAALLATPATSPRLVGESAYALGALGRRLAGGGSGLPHAAQMPAAIGNAGVMGTSAIANSPFMRALALSAMSQFVKP